MQEQEDKRIEISIIIPVFNEEENLVVLYPEIKHEVEKITNNYEIIFINDGSTDNTQKVLELIKKSDTQKSLSIIQFRKNFGKAESYKAGFKFSHGNLIFTIDGDIQDDPKDIKLFLDKIEEGYDLVIGWKYKRRDKQTKIIASKLFNFILRVFTKLDLHDFDNGYRCFKREILPHIDLYEGLYRYIPIFASKKGFRVGEVKINHRRRKFGKSKYGFSRLFGAFFDLMTIQFLSLYIRRPLHFFGGIGFVFTSIGFTAGIHLTYLRLFLDRAIGTRPLLFLAILFIIIGIQFILFGLIGEMIANMSRKEKNYSIKKII